MLERPKSCLTNWGGEGAGVLTDWALVVVQYNEIDKADNRNDLSMCKYLDAEFTVLIGEYDTGPGSFTG